MYSPDSKWIASGSHDGTIILWDTNGQVRHEWAVKSSGVNGLAFSPDGRYISACTVESLEIWDLGQEKCLIATPQSPTSKCINCDWSPDGTALATSTVVGAVCFWDTETFQERHHMEGSGGFNFTFNVKFLHFSPNGRWLATDETGKHYICHIWDVPSRTSHKQLRGHTDLLTAAAFDPTSTRIATASRDKTVRIWDVETGESLFVMRQHTSLVWVVSFSPDGSLVLSASDDHTVKIWDASTGAMIASLEGHSDKVQAACFSPCGTHIASASWDGTMRLWRTRDGTCIRMFTECEGPVWCVTFSPDGKTLSSGAEDGTVIIRQMADILRTE